MIEARTDGQWVRIEIILPNGEEEGLLDHCGDPEAVASYLNSLNADRLVLEQCRKDLAAVEGILRDLKEDKTAYQMGLNEGRRVGASIGLKRAAEIAEMTARRGELNAPGLAIAAECRKQARTVLGEGP